MKRIPLFVLCLASVGGNGFTAQFKINDYTFTLPDGFVLEKVAGPPLVNRPIVCDFDEQGRLYVADSSGNNDNVQKQLQERTHRIVRLEDFDGDGKFDKTVTFADKMMFPEGVMWFDGAVYCGAPPSIWKLEDTDGDGVADRRTEWFQGKTLTGCANDLHGPYLGPDGWIYWCKGAFAKQTWPGITTISDSAAHIFRQRPDGTEFDSVMSGGMDNPVEIAFTAAGDPIFTTTFYTNPSGGKRDALVHAIYGSVFPKVHGVLDGLKRTGELMPALTHLGPAAPSGLTRYASTVFGRDYEGNLFSSQFNLHKIQRHILETFGGTFRSKDIDFLVCDNPDFHPTDVLEDADGSLLVLDTGGWYKLCCPTSQLAKPEVLGTIYRIRREGAVSPKDPRGLKLAWHSISTAELANRLEDPRFAVQKRAILALRKTRDVRTIESILRKPSRLGRLNAVWTLTGMEGSEARKGVRSALSDSDPIVQQAAAHSCGLYRDPDAVSALQGILRTASTHVRRQAATALGQIGEKQSVRFLLEAAQGEIDRALEHSLIYALIQINDPEKTRAALGTRGPKDPSVQRVALIALDQMENGHLIANEVVPLLGGTPSPLQQAANWVVSHHAEWAGDLIEHTRSRLESGHSDADLQAQIVRFVKEPKMQQLVAGELLQNRSPEVKTTLLDAIAESNLKAAPAAWGEAVAGALQDPNSTVAHAGIRAAKAITSTNKIDPAIEKIVREAASDSKKSDDLRLELMSLLPARSAIDPPLFHYAVGHLTASNPVMQRINAASVVGRANLTEEQLAELSGQLPEVGPLEITRLLPAFDGHASEELGLKLIAGLKQSKGTAAVPPEMLRSRFAKYPEKVQQAATDLLKSFDLTVADKKKRLDEFEASLPSGDIHRGHLIFNGTKAACATCHAVGYLGGQVGPDLTRIGAIRTQRDLLEAILYPSASFARGFEPMVILTKDGEEHSGLVRKEASDSLLLVSGPAAEQRILRSDIREMRPSTVSVMPEGLEQQLSKQEMSDLVAFLRALK